MVLLSCPPANCYTDHVFDDCSGKILAAIFPKVPWQAVQNKRRAALVEKGVDDPDLCFQYSAEDFWAEKVCSQYFNARMHNPQVSAGTVQLEQGSVHVFMEGM